MSGTNKNTFSDRSYFPAREYAAAFPSPTYSNTAINTLPTGSFFQANQFQITDQSNIDSFVLSISDYAVKRLADAYLAINRFCQSGGLYPANQDSTQQRFRKTATHNGLRKYFTKTTTSKRRNHE